jgi:tRNA (cmo5U34)-methyltransferase
MSLEKIDFDKNSTVPVQDYDDMAAKGLPGYQAVHVMVSSMMQSLLPETANLLVVGAGTGMELIQLGQNNPGWQLLGVDPSDDMLAIAKDKVKKFDLSTRVKIVKGYCQDLPDTFVYDGATSILVMHFIADDGGKLEFLQNIAKRLKSSAPLVIVDIFGNQNSPEFQFMAASIQKYWGKMGMPTDIIEEGLKKVQSSIYSISEARTIELLEKAGFKEIYRFYTGLWAGGWIAKKI